MPSRPTSSTRPSLVDDERQRVPAAGELEPDVAGHDLHVGVGDGAEAPVGHLLAQRAVQEREHAAGAVLVGGCRAQRMAGERRDGRRLGALALDVADQRRPAAVAGAVEVVEVAAELDALAGRVEAHRRRQAGHVGQRARSQRALEGARDRALALVEAGVGDRHRRQAAELGEDRVVAGRELALGHVDHLERAEVLALGAQPDAQPRGVGVRALLQLGRRRPDRRSSRLGGQDRDRRAPCTEHPAGGVGRQLQDLLRRQRGVDRDGGVGERAQLLHVLVLDARDLLHLVVAAGGDSNAERLSRMNSAAAWTISPWRPTGAAVSAAVSAR